MEWNRLLSPKRYRGAQGTQLDPTGTKEVRSSFTKDADRIVFSPQFRRLQDKTQVHLGPRIDIVRTRLTHSLEASSIGRSLGAAVGVRVLKKYGSCGLEAGDVGAIVAAACLAHDIGNTPFGHAGEEAIQHWFREEAGPELVARLEPEELADLRGFEANAQGFRVLTRLEGWRDEGGLRLTVATLGAFLKYPMPSMRSDESGKPSNTKFSYFRDDARAFEEIACELGLERVGSVGAYCRHPLAYLVEGADDISYLIADLEDGVESRDLDSKAVEDLLRQIVPESEQRSLGRITEPRDRVSYLRAKAIGALIEEATDAFWKAEVTILRGAGPADGLLSHVRSAEQVQAIKRLSRDKLYREPSKLVAEVAGYEVVHGLLDIYVGALLAVEKACSKNERVAPKYEKIHRLLGSPNVASQTPSSRYAWLLSVTDRVSAMGDTTAIQEYRRLKGISVGSPSGA